MLRSSTQPASLRKDNPTRRARCALPHKQPERWWSACNHPLPRRIHAPQLEATGGPLSGQRLRILTVNHVAPL